MKATLDDVEESCCDLCHGPVDADGHCPHCSSNRLSRRDSLIGRELGAYRLDELLGRGAMGVVYAATHVTSGASVAMKVLPEVHAGDPRRVRRFLNEAKTLSRVRHPNVVKILDAGASNEFLWIAMERLHGRLLSESAATGPMEPSVAIRIGMEVCDALEAAHRAGVIHRDVKPENVFLVEHFREKVKVLDFGIASADDGPRVTIPGAVTGTPAYMSPEQALSRVVTPSSDIYSLGVVLYELLTGRLPFTGPTPVVLTAHVHETPPAMDDGAGRISIALESAILHALEKDPAHRPPSARAFRAELEAASSGIARRRSLGRGALPSGPTRLRRGLLFLAGLMAAVVITTVWGFRKDGPEVVRVEGPGAQPAKSLAPAAVAPAIFASLPDFSGRDVLEASLARLGAKSLKDVFSIDLDTAAGRLADWRRKDHEAQPELVVLVKEVPLPGGPIELQLQFVDRALARIYVRLFDGDRGLETALESNFGKPGEPIVDFDGCPGFLWKGEGGRPHVLARAFTNKETKSTWRGLVIASQPQWDRTFEFLRRNHVLAKGLKSARDDLDANPARTTAARLKLAELLEREPGAHSARVELCRAHYDLGVLSEAESECQKALEGTRDSTTKARASYYLSLTEAALGKSDRARDRLTALRESLLTPGQTKEAMELLTHVEQRIPGLQGSRSAVVMQNALCRRLKFDRMTLPARAANIAREFGFRDDRELMAAASAQGLNYSLLGCDP